MWILIMVALLGMLAYAMSDGTQTGVRNLTEQQVSMAVSEVLDYSSAIRRVVQELRISGCRDDQLDFANTVYKHGITGLDLNPVGGNANAPTDGSCGIFHPNGGGLTPIVFDSFPSETPPSVTVLNGQATMTSRDIVGIGEDGVLDRTFVTVGMGAEICKAINDRLGIANPGGSPPEETNDTPLGDEATEIAGKTAFCFFRNDAKPRHVFHQLLIEN